MALIDMLFPQNKPGMAPANPQPQTQQGGGILAALLGADNPAAQWASQNRNYLGTIGTGIANGLRFGDLGAARTLDTLTAQEAQQKNATQEWLAKNYPQYANLPIDQGWQLAMQLEGQKNSPKAAPDPIKLGAGEMLFDPATKQPIYSAPSVEDPKDQFDYEQKLYTQYAGAEPVKTYREVKNGYERVRTSASLNTGQGDVGVVYGYMKMLDPGSVVREGEFATAEQTSGAAQQLVGIYNKLVSGERLTDQQRKQFIDAANALYEQASSNLSDLNTQFSGRASTWGVNPNAFLVAPETYSQGGNANDPLGLR